MLTWRILTLRCWVAFLMVGGGLLIVGVGGEGVLDEFIHLARTEPIEGFAQYRPLLMRRFT